jgi:hypothetical protein
MLSRLQNDTCVRRLAKAGTPFSSDHSRVIDEINLFLSFENRMKN